MLPCSVQLSYAFRTGALTGFVARRLVHIAARSTPDHIIAWEKQQELRAGRWTPFDHTFVPPGGPAALGRILRLSRVSELAVAGRYPVGECDAANLVHALFVDDGAGGCCIHHWPPCRCSRCIVVPRGLDELVSAVDTGATLTIVA